MNLEWINHTTIIDSISIYSHQIYEFFLPWFGHNYGCSYSYAFTPTSWILKMSCIPIYPLLIASPQSPCLVHKFLYFKIWIKLKQSNIKNYKRKTIKINTLFSFIILEGIFLFIIVFNFSYIPSAFISIFVLTCF